MTQHQHMPCTGASASGPAPVHVPVGHGRSLEGIDAARATTIATEHRNEGAAVRRTHGIWRSTAYAHVTPVFAPYPQRPKDHVT